MGGNPAHFKARFDFNQH